MIIIAELSIAMTISPGQLRHNNSDIAGNAHSRSYVLKVRGTLLEMAGGRPIEAHIFKSS